jgi:hypothetical protein
MRFKVLALTASMLLPVATSAADVPRPVAVARQQVESADYRLGGHLVRVDEKGTRVSYAINIKAHWFPGILRVLLEVVSPAEARVHVLLEMRPGEQSTIQIAHPGDASAITLPFEKWNEGPLGEEFAYEDFLEAPYFWTGQTALGEAKFGARNCDLIKSTPGASFQTHFTEVTSWLDHGSGFPVHVEKKLRGSANVKEITYLGLRQTQGIWSARQVEAKIRGHSGSTRLIIDRGAARAHLNLKDFGPTQLTHF